MPFCRLLTLATLAPLLACGDDYCGAESEDFSMREPLEEEEWSLIEEAWRDPSDDDCAWACETAYRRLTGWELVETSRCELEVEVSGDTADPETDAAVICSGTGVEHLCP